MKIQIFLMLQFAWLLTSLQTNAQSPGITINNYTSCEVFFQLVGAGDPTAPCFPNTPSGIIESLVPGGTIIYPNPTAVPIPGLTAGDNIVAVRIYGQYPGTCPPLMPSYQIGDVCTPFPQSVNYIAADSSTCNTCTVNVVWTPGSTLDFN